MELVRDVTSVLNEYSKELQQQKITQLGDNILSCFNRLIRKDDYVRNILIDEKYNITLLNRMVMRSQRICFLPGEKEIFAVSLLWGLTLTSGRQLPFIIDTPLGRTGQRTPGKPSDGFLPACRGTDDYLLHRYGDRQGIFPGSPTPYCPGISSRLFQEGSAHIQSHPDISGRRHESVNFYRLRISEKATFRLNQLKGRTGLTPNILCRIAICYSLNDPPIPNPAEYDERGQELNRYTLTGEWDTFFIALVKERCIHDKSRPGKRSLRSTPGSSQQRSVRHLPADQESGGFPYPPDASVRRDQIRYVIRGAFTWKLNVRSTWTLTPPHRWIPGFSKPCYLIFPRLSGMQAASIMPMGRSLLMP